MFYELLKLRRVLTTATKHTCIPEDFFSKEGIAKKSLGKINLLCHAYSLYILLSMYFIIVPLVIALQKRKYCQRKYRFA